MAMDASVFVYFDVNAYTSLAYIASRCLDNTQHFSYIVKSWSKIDNDNEIGE